MQEKRVGILEPGNRLRRRESNTLYLIRRVSDKTIMMLGEDGKSSFTVKRDSPLLHTVFEPVYD